MDMNGASLCLLQEHLCSVSSVYDEDDDAVSSLTVTVRALIGLRTRLPKSRPMYLQSTV